MTTKKRAVMIVAPVDFRDEELLEPKAVLEHEGVEVTIASTGVKKCYGVMGTVVVPEKSIDDIKVPDFDVFIFVGGRGATLFFNDPCALKLVQEAREFNKVLAAICIAPVIFANAGILNHHKATVFKSEEAILIERGAIYTANRVEYDDRIITANGPEAATQFARSILKELSTI